MCILGPNLRVKKSCLGLSALCLRLAAGCRVTSDEPSSLIPSSKSPAEAGKKEIMGWVKRQSKPKTPLESAAARTEPVILLILGDLHYYPVMLLKVRYLVAYRESLQRSHRRVSGKLGARFLGTSARFQGDARALEVAPTGPMGRLCSGDRSVHYRR